MKIVVLGSSAGGRFPQWNCNCRKGDGPRLGALNAMARTQSSIAVSANDGDWVLINASPDILTQICTTPALQSSRKNGDSGLAAVLLTGAQIDNVAGLLMLRESKTLPIYCTPSVWDDLTTGLPLMHVLSHYCDVQWHLLPINNRQNHQASMQRPSIDGIRFTPLALKGKAPSYSSRREQARAGDNIGLVIENMMTGKTLFYAPCLGEIEPHIEAAMHSADCVLVDGTVWTDDAKTEPGFSETGSINLGHLPQSGKGGMIDVLDAVGMRRKILIHIDKSNPILDEGSDQRAILTQHGIEVAFDGMEIAV